PDVRVESPGAVRPAGDVSRDVTADPVDPARGDLHLRRAVAGAIGRARPLAEVPEDIDGQPRGPRPDVGADRLARGERAARDPPPPARTPGPAAVSAERPRSRRPWSGRRDRHEARGPSMTLHELGWRGDAPPTRADSVGRVAVEHRNGYVAYTEAGEVAA